MHLDVEWEVQLGGATEALAQDFFLDLELVLVARVLVVASTAAGVVLAAGLDAMRGRLDDRIGIGSREAGLLLGEGRFDFLLGQDEGDEHGFAASVDFVSIEERRADGRGRRRRRSAFRL